MRVTKKMNKRKQKHDEDRKHASEDDGSGEEQNKTRTKTQPGQQHGEPSRRHPAEPERQHSRKLSKRRRAEPDSATSSKLPQASRKNAEPDVAGRPTTPQYCLFYRDFGSATSPLHGRLGLRARARTQLYWRGQHTVFGPGSGTTEGEPRTPGPSARTSAATGAPYTPYGRTTTRGL